MGSALENEHTQQPVLRKWVWPGQEGSVNSRGMSTVCKYPVTEAQGRACGQPLLYIPHLLASISRPSPIPSTTDILSEVLHLSHEPRCLTPTLPCELLQDIVALHNKLCDSTPRNQQQSPLLRLTAELRNNIFQLAL